MEPHATMGIRVRGCRIIDRNLSGAGGGKGLKKGTDMSILAILSSIGMSIQKIPFWKKLYRQGRRG